LTFVPKLIPKLQAIDESTHKPAKGYTRVYFETRETGLTVVKRAATSAPITGYASNIQQVRKNQLEKLFSFMQLLFTFRPAIQVRSLEGTASSAQLD